MIADRCSRSRQMSDQPNFCGAGERSALRDLSTQKGTTGIAK
jgi:hypothetical protein